MNDPTQPDDRLQARYRQRIRSNNKRGAKHAVNPAGTKIARAFERRVWSGRVRMPQ